MSSQKNIFQKYINCFQSTSHEIPIFNYPTKHKKKTWLTSHKPMQLKTYFEGVKGSKRNLTFFYVICIEIAFCGEN